MTSDGNLLVVATNGLFHVDAATGDRTLLSGPSLGAGPMYGAQPFGLVQATSGEVYFAEPEDSAIYRIDLATGDRALIAEFEFDIPPGALRVGGVVLNPDGTLLVAVPGNPPEENGGIFRVDLLTGDYELLPGSDTGFAWDLARLNADTLAVSRFDGNLWMFDESLGVYSLLSGSGVGEGPDINPVGILVYVPEPSTLVMAVLSAGMLCMCRAHRRRIVR